MNRIYDNLLLGHFLNNRQIAFISGPRQVGKTTSSINTKNKVQYLNWDNQNDRIIITKGPDSVIRNFNLDQINQIGSRIVFDEIHKYSKWKNFIKGFFDKYGDDFNMVVTGSARLNVYKKGGDSLMGRYFLYRIHPLSVGELLSDKICDNEIKLPMRIEKNEIEQLLKFGGFPEPFLKGSMRFHNKWNRLKLEQFFYEDLRDLSKVQEIKQIETLAELIRVQTGQLLNYSSLSKDINISVDTVRRWHTILDYMYYSFTIRPWFKNVPKSLRKQPKVYLWDWSVINDIGAKHENFIASHLQKAVHFWTDTGLGNYDLYFLRDKLKREVDFLVTKNDKPWFIVEVKSSNKKNISDNLKYYRETLNVDHSFQIVFNTDYIERDCFTISKAIRVPVSTFLSQLV